MEIKRVTFWSKNIYDEGEYKSDLDRLNDYIADEKIDRSDIINVETDIDPRGNRCLNLFYWTETT